MTTEKKQTMHYTLLWSQSQCALHIEPMEDMLSENRQAFVDDRRMDYVPIAFGSEEHCREVAEQVRPTLAERQEIKSNSQGTQFE